MHDKLFCVFCISNGRCFSHKFYLFFIIFLQILRSTLFPYTTLFRSLFRHSRARQPDRRLGLGSVPADLADRKSTRLNSSHQIISYAAFCLKKKKRPSRPARTSTTVRAAP